MTASQVEGQWTYRTADLSAFAGKYISSYQVVSDSSSPAGTYDLYFGDITIISLSGLAVSVYDGQQGSGLVNVYNTGQTNISAVEENSISSADAEQPKEVTAFYHGDQIGSARLVTTAGG